jgi:CheY-like chemotaxis protein
VRAASDGEGKGATFTVELPSAILRVPQDEDSRIHPRSQARSASPLPEISLEGVRVLIVDDEADAAAMLRQLLERSRAEVAVVASVDQALELLEHDQYDVLVSDIGMPRRDGFELIAEVRKRGLRLPAAALTAFARAEDRTRALLAGFQAHVPKPVEPAELVATIASLARRTRL